MKKRIIRCWSWVKKKKYYILTFLSVFFIIWLFCLPKKLFNNPTSTILLDDSGNLLSALIADDGQWRFPHNDSIPYKFKTCIIQFEDRNFPNHIGISFKGIGRAIFQNISTGKVVSGGSTITMQVIRMSRNNSRTYWEKLVEMFMATRLEATYSKNEILALYASNAPMGGNVVGLDAASWRYFGRPSYQLSWAESSLLAVLPNAPSLLHLGRNQDLLKKKRDRLLTRLLEIKEIDSSTYKLSIEEPIPEEPKTLPQLTPHLITQLIKEGKKGQVIKSSINSSIQEHCLKTIDIHHQRLKLNYIFNAAIIVGDIKTGKIISYVGNTTNTELEHGSDVDLIQAPRSSGSILKPFLYQAMLEEGLISPSQLIPDIPIAMSGYSPINYNEVYDGAVPAHEALSKSLNVPFVLMLRDYSVPKFKDKLIQNGMTNLTKPANHYGLSLILGGAETKLIDLVNMYAILAQSLNTKVNYYSFVYSDETPQKNNKKIDHHPGCSWFTVNAMKQVKRPFGESNWQTYSSSREIAWKTGTSYGYRDAWAIGFDSRYIVGVWVGNADGEGRPGIVGIDVAAPMLFDVFDGLPYADFFSKPHDYITTTSICSKSGFRASEYCSEIEKKEVPLIKEISPLCPYHQKIYLDKKLSNRVNSSCYPIKDMTDSNWFVLPAKMELYYKRKNPLYITLPPLLSNCKGKLAEQNMDMIYPKHESKIKVPIDLNNRKQKIVLEATSKHKNASLYWHLDNFYIGKTSDIHLQEADLTIGKHQLYLIDNFGETLEITFEVVK